MGEQLKAQYAGNAGFLPKIDSMSKGFKSFRRTRPDGNCFYRAYIYGIFEQLPGNKARQAFLAARAKQALDFCLKVGYEKVAIEDFWEEFGSCVEKLSAESATSPATL